VRLEFSLSRLSLNSRLCTTVPCSMQRVAAAAWGPPHQALRGAGCPQQWRSVRLAAPVRISRWPVAGGSSARRRSPPQQQHVSISTPPLQRSDLPAPTKTLPSQQPSRSTLHDLRRDFGTIDTTIYIHHTYTIARSADASSVRDPAVRRPRDVVCPGALQWRA